jgi:hypothetical protein
MLSNAQIHANTRLRSRVYEGQLSNFEERMISETKLYWILYEHTSHSAQSQQTRAALRAWRNDWQVLFGTLTSLPHIVRGTEPYLNSTAF